MRRGFVVTNRDGKPTLFGDQEGTLKEVAEKRFYPKGLPRHYWSLTGKLMLFKQAQKKGEIDRYCWSGITIHRVRVVGE
jgi:hypothetical protein